MNERFDPETMLRSPRECLAGYAILPRLIDKVRLHARGILPEDYHPNLLAKTEWAFDGRFLLFTGIDPEDLREAILSSQDDEVVGHWVQQNAQDRSQEEIRAWSYAIMTSLLIPTPERIAKRTLFYPGPAKVLDLSSLGSVNPCDLIDFDEGRISREELLRNHEEHIRLESRPADFRVDDPEDLFLFDSERLLFRNFHLSDTNAVHRYASDPLVTQMTYWGPYSLTESESFIRRAIRNATGNPRSFYDLAIVSKESGPLSFPIGGCKIHVTDRENGEGEIGYYLERKSWNQGFATETARALLSFGFARLGLHRMVALCFVENRGSAHVLEKIGMVREGILRKHRLKEGRWVDSFLYSILDPEWKSFQENGSRNGPEGVGL